MSTLWILATVDFGGKSENHRGEFVPTSETLAFIVAGGDLETRFTLHTMLFEEHFFAKHDVLSLAPAGTENQSEVGASTSKNT